MKLLGRLKIRKILKEQGKSRFINSVGHALDGIQYTTSHEKNFRIEIILAILVIVASLILKVSLLEWAILVFVIAMVIVLELVNAAIERCVVLVTKDYKELAKLSKDITAGSVFVMSMFSVVIGIIIF